LFVTAVSFLYSSLQKDLVTRKVAVTAVSAIALLTAMLALMAILLGSRILRHWHRQGEKLIDSDANGDLVGCYHVPRRHLPDKTHTWSIDVFGWSLPAVFVVFWVLAICWVQGWLGPAICDEVDVRPCLPLRHPGAGTQEDARQDRALARGDLPRGNQVPHLLQALLDGRVLAGECGVADDPLRDPDEPLEVGGWRSRPARGGLRG
jgi:hypothetical protein